jgi:hypothetical protein
VNEPKNIAFIWTYSSEELSYSKSPLFERVSVPWIDKGLTQDVDFESNRLQKRPITSAGVLLTYTIKPSLLRYPSEY